MDFKAGEVVRCTQNDIYDGDYILVVGEKYKIDSISRDFIFIDRKGRKIPYSRTCFESTVKEDFYEDLLRD